MSKSRADHGQIVTRSKVDTDQIELLANIFVCLCVRKSVIKIYDVRGFSVAKYIARAFFRSD